MLTIVIMRSVSSFSFCSAPATSSTGEVVGGAVVGELVGELEIPTRANISGSNDPDASSTSLSLRMIGFLMSVITSSETKFGSFTTL